MAALKPSIEDSVSCSPLPTGGYDDGIFVNPPGEGLGVHCPVCLLVLREPHLLACCGRHLCEVCMRRIKNAGNACPCCRAEHFNTLLNKGKRGVVHGLKVYCTNKDTGCTWTGEMGEVERHLQKRCDHVLQDCPNGCGQSVSRHSIQDHITHKCIKRPIEAQLKCLIQDMMAKVLTLETKYEEKVSILEEKIRQQDVKIIEQEVKLAEQEKQMVDGLEAKLTSQEERLRKEFKQQNHALSKELEVASASCTENTEKVNGRLQKIEDNLFFQIEIPINHSKNMLTWIAKIPSWRNALEAMKKAEVQIETKESSIKLQCSCRPARLKVEEAAERVRSVIASLHKRIVTFPPERKEVLQYLLKNRSWLAAIKGEGSFIDIGDNEDELVVVVYRKELLDEVCLELQGFIKNKEKKAQLSVASHYKLCAFAKSKSVHVKEEVIVVNDRYKSIIRALIGGKFDVLLVEDYIRSCGQT